MVSLEFPVEMASKDPLAPLDHRGCLDNRDRLVEGPCTSGGGRAPVPKLKALS